jgi:hypothetical protein
MWQDPVVAETQLLRDEYASQFNYDIDAIFEDLMAKQAKHPERVVSFLPRESLDSNKLIKIMQSTAIDNLN